MHQGYTQLITCSDSCKCNQPSLTRKLFYISTAVSSISQTSALCMHWTNGRRSILSKFLVYFKQVGFGLAHWALFFQGGVWEAGGVLWGSGAGVRLQSICRTNDSCQSSHYLYYAEDRELNSLIHTLLYQRLCLGSRPEKRSFIEFLKTFHWRLHWNGINWMTPFEE